MDGWSTTRLTAVELKAFCDRNHKDNSLRVIWRVRWSIYFGSAFCRRRIPPPFRGLAFFDNEPRAALVSLHCPGLILCRACSPWAGSPPRSARSSVSYLGLCSPPGSQDVLFPV